MSNNEKRLSFWQVLHSVLASFIGVQSNEKRERDFRRGRARDFILVGIVITCVFILVVYGVVRVVMGLAGV